MICPTCNTANRDDAKFCKGCGKRLPTEASAPASTPAANSQVVEVVAEAPAIDEGKSETPSSPPAATTPEQPTAMSQPVTQSATQPTTQPAPASVSVDEVEDISLAPTQILTPEQMMAFHARRWQQEEQAQGQQTPGTADASAPTNSGAPLAASSEPAAPAQNSTPDIADMPTMVIAPSNRNGEQPIPIPPPPPPSSLVETPAGTTAPEAAATPTETARTEDTPTPVAGAEAENTPSRENSGETGNTDEAGQTGESGATGDGASEQENEMVQQNGSTEQHEQGEQDEQPETSGEFGPLAVGTKVAGRYEVTQVSSESAEENVYQVVDRQGYQRCWNCGSTQNAEGDEFCIDCGAELLDFPYVMHEYPPSSNKEEDSAVLHGTIVNTFMNGERTYVVVQSQVEQDVFPNGVHLVVATDSDAGNVRRAEPNEDSTLALVFERVHESLSAPAGVFIVADGLGGHDNGQLASRVAINIIAERVVRELLAGPLDQEKSEGEAAKPAKLDEDTAVAILHGAVADANDILVQMNQQDKTDMGSTLTGFMVVGDQAYIVNVGDSRTYMVRGGQIYQLTTDHSLVAQLVAGGLIQPEDVYTHPQRSQIFRSLGDKHNVQIDIFKQQIHPGDILLSCSDGLWEMVRNPQIESILNQAPNPQVACSQLLETANTNGGEDNVSAVVVFVY